MIVSPTRKRNASFFDRFEEAAQNNIEGARLLAELWNDVGRAEAIAQQLHALEHRGDEIGHAAYDALNQTFIPPLDREDIIALTIALDQVIDLIHEAGDAASCYGIAEPHPAAQSLAAVVLRSTEAVAAELPKLRQRRELRTVPHSVHTIHELEIEADELLRQAVTELFRTPQDPLRVFAWTRILETMEQVTDRCEDVADVLLGLAIKHG